MKKSLLIVCLAMLAFIALSMPLYAAVQNIKLSGDLLMRGISRWEFDFTGHGNSSVDRGAWNEKAQNYLMTTARVRLDADLTDNVSATVRLLNERKWGNTGTDSRADGTAAVGILGSGLQEADDNLRLDLAFATLKEFLYAPLTLTIGRQRMQFGNAMIIGDPDTNIAAIAGEFNQPGATVMQNWINSIYYTPAPDLSEQKSFDAIRATINLAPWTFDAVYAKLDEQDPAMNDDTTLAGLNTGYQFDFKNTFGEMYYFAKSIGRDDVSQDGGSVLQKNDQVHTIGARVSTDPWDNFNVQVELASQFGRYNPQNDPNHAAVIVHGLRRAAWASELSASYDFTKMKFNPKVSGTYAYFSGDPRSTSSNSSGDQKYHGWDPMFENQTFGHIANALFKQTNMHIWMLKGSFVPLEDITVDLNYSYYRLNKGFNRGDRVVLNGLFNGRQYIMDAHDYLGQELDVNVSYDYTEDVQFGLLGGLFFPGDAFSTGDQGNTNMPRNHKTAKELIGSMKVTF